MTADQHPAPAAALVVEGGAMRGIFSTGVLDGFLARGFNPFDIFFGVSSGACNLASFLARMPGRNLKIYTDYSLRPEFFNWRRALTGGPFMDLDWLWRVTIKEIRLDLKTMYAANTPFIVGLTGLDTGKPIYKHTDETNVEDVLKASSALPILYNKFPVIDGVKTLDGGFSDPLPVRAAIDAGATKIMVVRTRTKTYTKQTGPGHRLLQWRLFKHPALKVALQTHARRYNQTLDLIRTPPQGVKIIEICPPDHFDMNRLEKSPEKLQQAYVQGKQMAEQAICYWEKMKVQIEKTVPFFGVDQDLVLYPGVLLNYFQEAVGIHAERAKDELPALMEKGRAWILSRIGLEIHQWPRLGDRLTITTWHTGDRGFKAFRDFEVCRDRSTLIRARTMWLFIDLDQKKILRIPKTTGEAYTSEAALPLDMDLDAWVPAVKFTPEKILDIGIRSSDFDPLGHVNNALYVDFLHHLIASELPGQGKPARILLQYVKEIPRGTGSVRMGLEREKGGYRFKIFSDTCVHGAGTFTLAP